MSAVQISAIFNAAPVYRPATSPVPSLFGDLRKISQARAGAGGGVAAAAAAHQQGGGARVSLRPLPPRGLAGMVIEGSRTGEEKAVAVIDRREPIATRPVAAERKPREEQPKEDLSASKDQRIRQLETQLRRVQEQLRTRISESNDLRETAAKAGETIAHQQSRIESLESEVESLSDTNASFNKTIAQLKAQLQQAAAEAESHAADATLLRQKSAVHAVTSDERQKEAAKRLEEAVKQADLDRTRLTAETHAWKSQVDELNRKLLAAKEEASLREALLSKELNERRSNEAKSAGDAVAARTQLAEREAKVLEWRKKIDLCNEYIVKICQPQFSVVKDESLTPIQTGVTTPENGGFVLVPLPLLLEGYGLLPVEVKRKIADDYETSKGKEGSSGATNAGAFAGARAAAERPVHGTPEPEESCAPARRPGGKASYSLRSAR